MMKNIFLPIQVTTQNEKTSQKASYPGLHSDIDQIELSKLTLIQLDPRFRIELHILTNMCQSDFRNKLSHNLDEHDLLITSI